ncbi:MAG: MBOAT family protein [Myxococcales bacterium]|nr:MBOAT family protein [Myxococcales bacterium]
MLFNSYVYILIFLPAALAGYFWLNRLHYVTAAKAWLVGASLFFYGYWNPAYLTLILLSVFVNFGVGTALGAPAERRRRPRVARQAVLSAGILFNLGLLGYYKYADFFIRNVNTVFSTDLPLLRLVLPLAISFFTFQQIAYLVDSYRRETEEFDFLSYALFVTFFPQLIAGPIVHHQEMMPQFADLRRKVFNPRNVALGLFIFAIGLFKKVMVADEFGVWATNAFDTAPSLGFFEAWSASLCYTFQLYFDFSGYTDMAIGSALMFNIALPINFNSPYKALDIADFWRRWHMTLSRWLRNYLYIPLGGNRLGALQTYRNLFITFLLGGLWHGAAWTFVAWGALHGVAAALHRLWRDAGMRMPRVMAWLVTFVFVDVAWVFFRAKTFADALKVLKGMVGLGGFTLPEWTEGLLGSLAPSAVGFGDPLLSVGGGRSIYFYLVGSILVVAFARNSVELGARFRPNLVHGAVTVGLLTAGVLHLARLSEFLYFNF